MQVLILPGIFQKQLYPQILQSILVLVELDQPQILELVQQEQELQSPGLDLEELIL